MKLINLRNYLEELTSQTGILEEVGETHFGEVERDSVKGLSEQEDFRAEEASFRTFTLDPRALTCTLFLKGF